MMNKSRGGKTNNDTNNHKVLKKTGPKNSKNSSNATKGKLSKKLK